jgi:sRNA-binding protein
MNTEPQAQPEPCAPPEPTPPPVESAAPDTPVPIEQAAPQAEAPAPPAAAEQDLSPAATGTRLAALFPALFVGPGAPGPFKPIKLRIHADIAQRAPGQFSKRVLGIFFSRYTTTTAYLKALTAPDAKRFDLDGQPAGEIAEEHRNAAVEELARRQAIVAERRAAQRQAQAPQRREDAPRPGSSPKAHRAAREPAPRRDRASFDAPPPKQRASRPAEREPRARNEPTPVLPMDPALRERALLLRAFESSPLSKANFCALKRMTEAQLDTLLEQARHERS